MTPVELVAGLAAFSLLVLLLCSVLPVWLELRRPHRTRRGGYLRPRASAPTKDGGQRRQGTGTSARTSSYSPPGRQSVVTGYLPLRVQRSKPIAPTSSGNATGVAGASGARALAKRVGSDE